jgi:N6-adenosine-specific RNA methylase IME4
LRHAVGFPTTEIFAIYEAAGPPEIAAALERKRTGKKVPGVKLSQGGKTGDRVGKFAGVSGVHLQKIIAVMTAARTEPDKFGDLPAIKNKSVNGAYRFLNKRRDEARVRRLVPVPGKFPTLVIDPPRDYEWLSLASRAAPGYAVMSHEKLMALDVAQWAADDCAVYCWVTNNFMTRGIELMAKWGFDHKTVLTWVKPKIGLGSYFRNTTEHLLFGIRGNAKTRRDDVPTHFEAPMLDHSEKPEKFYDLVRASSYPTYGEIFQRAPRPDFQNLYRVKEHVDEVVSAAEEQAA